MRTRTEGGERVAGQVGQLKVESIGYERDRLGDKIIGNAEEAAFVATNCKPRLLRRGNLKRAGDRIRTGDNQLGKLALYQLSYARGELRFRSH